MLPHEKHYDTWLEKAGPWTDHPLLTTTGIPPGVPRMGWGSGSSWWRPSREYMYEVVQYTRLEPGVIFSALNRRMIEEDFWEYLRGVIRRRVSA